MTDKQGHFGIKEINFFHVSSHEHIIAAKISGLGNSYFMSSSETVQLQSYLLNPIKFLTTSSFAYMPFEPTFCHEMGNCQLAFNAGHLKKDQIIKKTVSDIYG
jgi:hypothetical protein